MWKTQANLIDIHHIATDQIFICVGPDSPLYDKKVTIEDAKKYSSFALDMKNAYKQNTYVDSGLKRKKQQKFSFQFNRRLQALFAQHRHGFVYQQMDCGMF